MGIVQKRVSRKDQTEDHAHKMPDGTMTGCALWKPNKDRTFPHTHLYQFEGKTCETDVADEGPGHVHEVAGGETGGPVAVQKSRGSQIPDKQ